MEQVRGEERYLIYLISCALTGRKAEKIYDNTDMDRVLKIAKRQRVGALAFEGINKELLSDEILKKFEHENNLSIWMHGRQEVESEILFDAFQKSCIRFMPLKGLIIKEAYPEGYLRTMSDMDILIDEERAEDAKSIMEQLGYKTEEFGIEHHDRYSKGKEITVEIHRSIMSKDTDRHKELYSGFENVWNDSLIEKDKDNTMMYRQIPEEFYVFMMAHAAKHFFWSGFGIRFVTDCYVYRQKYGNRLDKEYLNSRFGQMKIQHFTDTLEKLSDIWFSPDARLDSEDLFRQPGLSESDIRDLESMERLLFSSTVYGDTSQSAAAKVNNENIVSKNDLVIKSAARRMFPQKKYMIPDYPVLKTKGWVLFFCWLDRMFRWLFSKNRKSMKAEIDTIKAVDMEKIELKNRMTE